MSYFAPFESIILLILVVFLLFIGGYAYFQVKWIFNAMNNKQKIQSFILQLPILGKGKGSSNKSVAYYFLKTFTQYIDYLITQKKMTNDQKAILETNAVSAGITFLNLYKKGVIQWKTFINDYYYANAPQLKIVDVNSIDV